MSTSPTCRARWPGPIGFCAREGDYSLLDADWDSIVWHSRDSTRMRRVLAAWDVHLVDPDLPRRLMGLLRGAGFAVSHRAAIPLLNTGHDPNTYSAGLIGFIIAFVPGHQSLTDTNVQAWADDPTTPMLSPCMKMHLANGRTPFGRRGRVRSARDARQVSRHWSAGKVRCAAVDTARASGCFTRWAMTG
jgi:hypothetical protein